MSDPASVIENLATPEKSDKEFSVQFSEIMESKLLHEGLAKSIGLGDMLKAETDDPPASSQTAGPQRRPHPFNMQAVLNFKNTNSHHSTCIEAKSSSIVGLGHEKDTIAEILDPLCGSDGWQSRDSACCEDETQTGNGYLEIVRDGTQIKAIYVIQSPDIHVYVDDVKTQDYHYVVIPREGYSTEIKMARFGDLADAQRRLKDATMRSEVIHFKNPSSLSRWYGYPDWLAAVISVEIVQMLDQHTYDYFLNRCVPELMVLFSGAKVSNANWSLIQSMFKKNIGQGNTHKTMALNIDNPDLKVQVERLGTTDESATQFSDYNNELALRIVSAHQVPPLLAGIQIPGKLGASNEMLNAMMAFQALVVGPAQRLRQSKLDVTLGNPAKNGGLAIKRGDFKYKKITDEIQEAMKQPGMAAADTVARSRSQVGAGTNGRDLSAGVKT